MQATTVENIRRAIGGALVCGHGDLRVAGVSTDSRSIKPGELFFALRGERFDGHDFVGAALARGAVGAVVARVPANVAGAREFCLISVPDPLSALQQWAKTYRAQFDLVAVGVTGSTGKTTTKEMVARVLGLRWQTLATPGNFNNEIGLPLTLCQLGPEHGALVVEMGMRGRGEIAFLCSLAQPNSGVITNVGPAHLERLGSLENIAAAKGELLASLAPGSLAVLNYDDPYCRRLGEKSHCTVRYYGFDPGAQVRAREVRPTPQGYACTVLFEGEPVALHLPLWGRHNVANALAALTLGFYLGLAPQAMVQTLAEMRAGGMRLEAIPGPRGSLVLNDAYNANPASTKAALTVLAERRPERAVAVLGDMLELGTYAGPAHREVGEMAAALKIDLLVTIGSLAAEAARAAVAAGMPAHRVHVFATKEEALPFLRENLRAGDLVLVKASRALALEHLVAALQGEG